MKNIYKSFALLCMGFAAAACVEENFENDKPKYDTTPGNEIVFSATAGIESGDKGKDTKTVYGDTTCTDMNKDKGWIEINWVNGDMISIASPEAVGPETAHYKVVKGASVDNPNTTDKDENEDFHSSHSVAELARLGDSGLQWSGADKYNFYGIYPSIEYDSDKTITGTGETAVPSVYGATTSLSKDGIFTGTMPIDQHYTLTGDSKNGYVASPDMRYAFMTAHKTYDPKSEAPITMNFKSMVTALQFDIQPNTINIEKDGIQQMEVVSVSLLSNKGISGDFRYDISAGAEGYTNTHATRMTSIHFDDAPVTLTSKGGSLNVTFFILPEEFADAEDYLRLQILFKLGSTPLSRIATINTKNIKPGKKYIFNDVLLPEFVEDVPASSWWDTLDPNTILPQISIPVASNVFANIKYGVTEAKNQQQSETLETLWSMGVRGFEICCQSAAKGARDYNFANGAYPFVNDGTEFNYGNEDETDSYTDVAARSLRNCRVMSAQTFVGIDQDMSFHKAFDLLCGLLKSKGSQNECLFVICTYMAGNDGYCPYNYVSNLVNYLDWYSENNTRGITKETFEMISDATTVGDLRGKIAIIVRPGEDQRWANQTAEYTNPATILEIANNQIHNESLTGKISQQLAKNSLVYSEDWKDKIMIIEDWGNESYDVWDRRYGNEYARQAAYIEGLPTNRSTTKKYFEDYLWASTPTYAALGSTSYTASTENSDHSFPSNVPTSVGFNYEHKMSNGNFAYVQEWSRVIPQNGLGPIAVLRGREGGLGVYWSNRTIWAKWPESINEKKDAIEGLFQKSIKTRGEKFSDIYINVLSGYYADYSVSTNSLQPYRKTFSTSNGNISSSGPGRGGDFAKLAKELNKYTYDLLSADIGSTNGLPSAGPWGLVMMDHINTTRENGFASADLVELIMMNNFKFEMSTKICQTCNQDPCVCTKATYNATYTNGGNAISFE